MVSAHLTATAAQDGAYASETDDLKSSLSARISMHSQFLCSSLRATLAVKATPSTFELNYLKTKLTDQHKEPVSSSQTEIAIQQRP